MRYAIRWFKCKLKPPKNRNNINKAHLSIAKKRLALIACNTPESPTRIYDLYNTTFLVQFSAI